MPIVIFYHNFTIDVRLIKNRLMLKETDMQLIIAH